MEQVELATLEWVWWWNTQRLHSELDYRTPIESEHEYYAETESLLKATASQENTYERNPGRFMVTEVVWTTRYRPAPTTGSAA